MLQRINMVIPSRMVVCERGFSKKKLIKNLLYSKLAKVVYALEDLKI